MFFFVSVFIFWASKNHSIYNLKISFDGKVNLVGELGGQNLKFPVVQKRRENPIKN